MLDLKMNPYPKKKKKRKKKNVQTFFFLFFLNPAFSFFCIFFSVLLHDFILSTTCVFLILWVSYWLTPPLPFPFPPILTVISKQNSGLSSALLRRAQWKRPTACHRRWHCQVLKVALFLEWAATYRRVLAVKTAASSTSGIFRRRRCRARHLWKHITNEDTNVKSGKKR